jgi:hypothetical protein
MSTEA